MTNEQKAKELVQTWCNINHHDKYFARDVYNAVTDMAEWKEQQMIAKACEWLELYANEYAFADYIGDELNGEAYISNKLIQDFRKAMEEQL